MERKLQRRSQDGCLAIYIPTEITNKFGLSAGKKLDFSIEKGRIVMTLVR